MKNILVLYHANCSDGLFASWSVEQFYRGECEHIAVDYHKAPPDVTGRVVIIVDFSYKYEVLLEMSMKAKKIYIFDHHESFSRELERSRKENLPELERTVIEFDNNRSGAVLTWESLIKHKIKDVPESEVTDIMPKFLRFIEDRDLWRFVYEETKPFIASILSEGILSLPTEEAFRIIDQLNEDKINEHLIAGRSILKEKESVIKQIIKIGLRRINIAGYNVPFINAPYMYASDIGSNLAENEPFSVSYVDLTDGRRFSLRSHFPKKDSVDVSKIAELFGGGGHAQAAGFTIAFEDPRLLEFVLS